MKPCWSEAIKQPICLLKLPTGKWPIYPLVLPISPNEGGWRDRLSEAAQRAQADQAAVITDAVWAKLLAPGELNYTNL
ncbi:hypothetical protein C0081_22390 [Cohaesibacter celericrescens]|uniref:Uncharacterized protein n=1 Tax=Cohaesibacter celericrescens TaxID=2067669 RepID=A0A2N5XKK9_9HYPH|nr:hypothetical protein C0081_22390 [Cohaesibacter celericrescens]